MIIEEFGSLINSTLFVSFIYNNWCGTHHPHMKTITLHGSTHVQHKELISFIIMLTDIMLLENVDFHP